MPSLLSAGNAARGFRGQTPVFCDPGFLTPVFLGVHQVYGGVLCTYSDPRFYSYRREPRTGRMACVIWRD